MKYIYPIKKYKKLVIKFLFIIPVFFVLIFLSNKVLLLINSGFTDGSTIGDFELEQSGVRYHDKSILVLGIDREDDKEYADYISIFTFDTKDHQIKVFNINPKFSPYIQKNDQYVPFRSMLVFFQTFYPQENAMDKYLDYIEKTFTIDLDGYISVTEEGLEEGAQLLTDLNVSAPSELVDEDIQGFSIQKGNNKVDNEELLKFLSADENGDDDKLQRQLSAIQSLTAHINWWKVFIQGDQIASKLQQEVKSNLEGKDFFDILWEIKFNSVKYKVGYTSSNGAIRIENELDERWYTVFNTLDKDIQKVYINEDVKMEQANVDIFNSTSVSGLARSKARALENKGFRVVLVGNTDEKFENTTIFINSGRDYPNTINEIYNTFKGKNIDIRYEKYSGRSVGDIVIVIGENEIN